MTRALRGTERTNTGVAVAGGDDRFGSALRFSDWQFDCKLSGKDTGGDLCIYDTTRTGRGGPPTHVHFAQDEWFYVRTGEYLFKIGDETFRLKAGDSLFAPRNVPHAFVSLSDRSALMVAFQPAGTIEELFRGIAEVAKSRNPTLEDWRTFAPAHEFAVVGPPLSAEDVPRAMAHNSTTSLPKANRVLGIVLAVLMATSVYAILFHGLNAVAKGMATSLADQAQTRQHSKSPWVQWMPATLPSL